MSAYASAAMSHPMASPAVKPTALSAAEASTHLPRLYADVREAALHRAEQQAGGVVGAAACRTRLGGLQRGGGREEGEGMGMSGMGCKST